MNNFVSTLVSFFLVSLPHAYAAGPVRHAPTTPAAGPAPSTARELDNWVARLGNYPGVPATALMVQFQRYVGCSGRININDPQAVRAAFNAIPPVDTAPFGISMATGQRPVSATALDRHAEQWLSGDTVCKSEQQSFRINRQFDRAAVADLQFVLPRGSAWVPQDVGWLGADGILRSSNGFQDCLHGNRGPDAGPPPPNTQRTGYAIQAQGYQFRGHSIPLPLNNVAIRDNRGRFLRDPRGQIQYNPDARWRIQGEGVAGAFIRNGSFGSGTQIMTPGPFRLGGPPAVGSRIEVRNIRWGMDAERLYGVLDRQIAQYEAEMPELTQSERAQRRALINQLRRTQILSSLHNNDQNVGSEGTEVFTLYNRSLEENRRPIFYHHRDGGDAPTLAQLVPPRVGVLA